MSLRPTLLGSRTLGCGSSLVILWLSYFPKPFTREEPYEAKVSRTVLY